MNLSLSGMIGFDMRSIDAGLFTGCPNLQRVEMSYLDFRVVDISKFVGWFQDKPLKILWLSGSKWPSLERANPFSHFTHLEELRLDENGFTSIPDGAFDDMKNLTLLDLSGNQISLVTENTFSLETRERLQYLN
jgi:Leucine-rich repeat (LRR) protein